MKITMNQARVNRIVYWVAASFAAAMLAAYFAALWMALSAYSAGDSDGALLWAMIMLLPLALLWLDSVLAAPFIREMDAAKTAPTVGG